MLGHATTLLGAAKCAAGLSPSGPHPPIALRCSAAVGDLGSAAAAFRTLAASAKTASRVASSARRAESALSPARNTPPLLHHAALQG